MADQKSNLNPAAVVPAPRTAPDTLPDKPLTVPADYVRNVDTEHHLTEHVEGAKTTFSQDSKTDDSSHGQIDNRLMQIVDGRIEERQQAENIRANRRNRNRILILIVVLIMELAVPTLYGMHLLPSFFLKYEVLAITVPDAALTVYAYIRKY
jgi:hypothetical protein